MTIGARNAPFTLTFENKHDGSYYGDIAVDSITLKNCDDKASCTGGRIKKYVNHTIVCLCFFCSFFKCTYSVQQFYVHSQERHRVDASCGFYQPDASCQQIASNLLTSSSCIESMNTMKQLASSLHAVHNLQQVC